MATDRVLHLQGVHNFRDAGGYPVIGGGRLRRGLLWRSGQHFSATDADLDVINRLGLTCVFDLRSSHERAVHPCRRPSGFAAEVYVPEDRPAPVKDAKPAAPHLAAAQAVRRRDAATAREGMRANYHRIAFRPELVAMTGRYILTVAQCGGPSLINCMAGKDRTGIAVAMLQFAAGVHRDDVIADYLLTNTAGDVDARIAAGMASIRATGGDMDEAVLRVLMGVEAEYLEAALARIAQEHGSIDSYVRDMLGVDDATRARLRAALVET